MHSVVIRSRGDFMSVRGPMRGTLNDLSARLFLSLVFVALVATPVVAQGPSPRMRPSVTAAGGQTLDQYRDAVVVIETATRVGSGFFIDEKGTVLTNYHVVEDYTVVPVRLRDKRKLPGTVLAVDAERDLALVSLNIRSPAALRLAKIVQDSEAGAAVIAIGAPSGLDWSVTDGIISAVRPLAGMRMIQTNAAINRGNSGGPLIRIDCGVVIGVVTWTLRKLLDVEGLHLAVSSEMVQASFAKYLPTPAPGCGAPSSGEARNTSPSLQAEVPPVPAPSLSYPVRPLNGMVLNRTIAVGRGELTVRNDFRQDAVVTIRSVSAPQDSRLLVYVRAGDHLTLVDLANGEYELEFTVGRDWTGSAFARRDGTFVLSERLTYDDMPVRIRRAEGTQTGHVSGDSWTVTLRNPEAAEPAVKATPRKRSTR